MDPDHDDVDAVQLEFPRVLRMGGDKIVNELGKSVGNIIVKFYQTWYSTWKSLKYIKMYRFIYISYKE